MSVDKREMGEFVSFGDGFSALTFKLLLRLLRENRGFIRLPLSFRKLNIIT